MSFSSNYGFLLLFELRQLFFIPLSVIFDVESHGLYFFKDNVVSFFFLFDRHVSLFFRSSVALCLSYIYIYMCILFSR